jgi:hypothetical protein
MDADAGCKHFATERMMIERRDVEFEVEVRIGVSSVFSGRKNELTPILLGYDFKIVLYVKSRSDHR